MSDANFDADLDRDNFEKLCGKNGELVELRRKQLLIGYARQISDYCRTQKCNKKCDYWDDEDEYCLVAQKSFGDVVKPEDWYLRKDKL